MDDLRTALAEDNAQAVSQSLEELAPEDQAHAVSQLSEEEQAHLLALIPNEDAAELVEAIPEPQAAQILQRLPPEEAAAIFNEMVSDEQADLMARLPDEEAGAILEQMAEEEAADIRRLMQYSPDTAGGLMISEYLAYVDNLRVEDVLADLRLGAEAYRKYDVQYAYVVSPSGGLVGVLRLRDLLLASPQQPIAGLMITGPLRVDVKEPLEGLERFFDRHSLFGVPVVDEVGKLAGVVRRQDVEQAAEERSSRSFLEFTGIPGGEELRTMPLRSRSLRRLSWLSVNIVLNVIAASVIALHQDTLEAVIALAVFLPIISDMSGCSGSQAVAVSMRELSLGLIRPAELWRVLSKEAAVGVVNGLALGLLLGVVAMLWKGNFMLGLVVAAALGINTLVAVCIGGTVPLLLRRLGHDPALASGPILTTITDMCGFFLLLTLASAALPYLV